MIDRYLGEVGQFSSDLRFSGLVLRERVADKLVRSEVGVREVPLVGRSADIERIVSELHRLNTGAGLSFVVKGDAGVGKTRLLEECCRIAHLHGASVVRLPVSCSGRGHAFSTLSDLITRLLGIRGALGAAPEALACVRQVADDNLNEAPLRAVSQDSEARFALLRWAVLDLVEAVVSEAPLLLAIDDAHNMDAASCALLEDLQQHFTNRALGLLLAVRERYEHGESASHRAIVANSITHRLSPLSEAESSELIAKLAANHDPGVSAETCDRMAKLAGGNPLFILELFRHRRDLVDEATTPVTIQAILDRRLAALTPEALRVVQACAVLGAAANQERIEEVLDDEAIDVVRAFDELERVGLTVCVGARIQCRHDLLTDAVLKATAPALRRTLHRRVANILSRQVLKSRSFARLWQCMDHWKRGGTPARGLDVGIRLAKRLLSLGLAADSLAVLGELEGHCSGSRQRKRLLLLAARAHGMLRDWPAFMEVKNRLLSVDPRPSGRSRHSFLELFEYEALVFVSTSDSQGYEAMYACASDESASNEHRLDAAVIALIHADNQGRSDFAAKIYRAVRGLTPLGQRSAIAHLTSTMIYETSVGQLSSAELAAGDLVRHASSTTHPVARALILRRCGYAYRRLGHLNRAREVATEAHDIVHRLRLLSHEHVAIDLLSHIALDSGDFEAAERWLERGRGLARDRSSHDHLSLFLIEARLAFESDRLARISVPQAINSHHGATVPPRRGQQLIIASHAVALLAQGDESGMEDLLAQLMASYHALRTYGGQDYPTAVLVKAMMRVGQETAAANILQEYTDRFRREPTDIPCSLRRLCLELEVSPAPRAT